MKVINLNESQYRRLFEISDTVEALGDNNPSDVPPNGIYAGSAQVGIDGATTKDGIVPANDDANINRTNKLKGSDRAGEQLVKNFPYQWGPGVSRGV